MLPPTIKSKWQLFWTATSENGFGIRTSVRSSPPERGPTTRNEISTCESKKKGLNRNIKKIPVSMSYYQNLVQNSIFWLRNSIVNGMYLNNLGSAALFRRKSQLDGFRRKTCVPRTATARIPLLACFTRNKSYERRCGALSCFVTFSRGTVEPIRTTRFPKRTI